jgi:hypothetical protein
MPKRTDWRNDMTAQTLAQMHQSPAAAALPGTWKLATGRAITLQPAESGVLRVAHGSVWATFDGPQRGALNDFGDYIVEVGQSIRVQAGERVVIEAWGHGVPAYFSWDPVPATVRSRAPSFVGVLQPLHDLRLALSLGAAAAARLLSAVGRLAWDAVVPRGREALAECRLNAQAGSCRPHGA